MSKNHLISVLLLFAVLILGTSCGGNKKETPAVMENANFIEVKIEGMTCTGCEQTIQRNVGKLEGIKSIKATFTDGRAVIEYYPTSVDTLRIKDAITGSGYKVIKFSNLQPGEVSK